MGGGQSLYAVEPPNPPGFIHRIEQYVHEGGNFNYRLKYRAEMPATLQNMINPQLYALFIQKLDEAYQSGPLDADPCCSCDDSDYYRVANNRRDLALQVCNGANTNIFGPHNMRAIPCYRVKKEMAEGREVFRFYQLVDICANVSHTVVVQQIGMAPQVTTGIGPAPGTLAIQAQTQHPVAGTLTMGQPNVTMQQPRSPPPAYQPNYAIAPTYQPQHYQGQYPSQAYQAQPYPTQALPQPTYQGNGQPMYAQAQPFPTQGQPYPAQAQPYPAQGQPYPAQAQPYPSQSQSPPPPQYQAPPQPGMIQVQPQQPQVTTISTHTLTVLPDPYQAGFSSSGNAQAEQTPLQTQ